MHTHYACWVDIEGEDSYVVMTSIGYMVDCNFPSVRGEEVQSTIEVGANITHSPLPTPSDPRLTYGHYVSLRVTALDNIGQEIGRGGVTVQRDDFGERCQG